MNKIGKIDILNILDHAFVIILTEDESVERVVSKFRDDNMGICGKIWCILSSWGFTVSGKFWKSY